MLMKRRFSTRLCKARPHQRTHIAVGVACLAFERARVECPGFVPVVRATISSAEVCIVPTHKMYTKRAGRMAGWSVE